MRIFLLALFFVEAFNVYAQTKPEKIEIVKKGIGTVFQLDGINLAPKQLWTITERNENAKREVSRAKKNFFPAQVFSSIGGGLIGAFLGVSLTGGELSPALLGAGAGFIAISIPFSIGYSKHMKKAVTIYNDELSIPAHQPTSAILRVGPAYGGLGVSLSF